MTPHLIDTDTLKELTGYERSGDLERCFLNSNGKLRS